MLNALDASDPETLEILGNELRVLETFSCIQCDIRIVNI